LARDTQIKAQCGPRTKIVARPCFSGINYIFVLEKFSKNWRLPVAFFSFQDKKNEDETKGENERDIFID